MGDEEGAMKDYDKAIELNPNYSGAYNNRGNLRGDMGDVEGAMKDYDKAIELNPNYSKAYSNRAECYRRLAEKEEDPTKKAELISKAESDEMKAKSLKKGS